MSLPDQAPLLPRTTPTAVTVLLALLTVLGAGSSAQAATQGRLGLTPVAGNLKAVLDLTTDGPCPADTTHAYALLRGGSLPTDGQVLRDTARSGLSRDAAFTTGATRTLADAFLAAGQAPAAGEYTVELTCIDEAGQALGTFTGPLTLAAAGTWTSAPGPTPTAASLAAGGLGPPADTGAGAPTSAGAGAPGQPGPSPAGTPADGTPSDGTTATGTTATALVAVTPVSQGTTVRPLVGAGLLGGALVALALALTRVLRRRAVRPGLSEQR
ncbi:MAG: hypothetical protein H7233_16870 [Pseudorhodobacter sp.]|nr:hypothetical protein [Frankiaceae bacterium]